MREDGESVYYAFDPPDPADPWTAEHVLPILWSCPFEPRRWTRLEAAEDIGAFLAAAAYPANWAR